MTEKYRAKRKHDGEWVYGNCLIVHPAPRIVDFNVEKGGAWFVEADTVSRCSGLTACRQDVYEGDIVRLQIDHTTEFWTAVVRFGWHDTHEYGWYLEPIRDTVFTKRIGAWLGEKPAFGSTAAVIGNVWDNPEMMEEKHGEKEVQCTNLNPARTAGGGFPIRGLRRRCLD